MSEESGAPRPDPARAGLCATCTHVQLIPSSKGAVFYMCRLSEIDPAFARYPRLPVLSCAGYTPRGGRNE
jgi:hypothetical protein